MCRAYSSVDSVAPGARTQDGSELRVLFVAEMDLGHGSFSPTLADQLGALDGVSCELRRVGEPASRVERRLIATVPRLGHWDLQPLRWRLRYSARARGLLAAGTQRADVALVNTQACALLGRGPMRRLGTVVSVDATASQFSRLGHWRPHARSTALSDRPIDALERRAYGAARRVLAWSEWVAGSLRDDYGVYEERIAVVHPGIDVDRWEIRRAQEREAGPLRVLFVGNRVWRKGLGALLEALERSSGEVVVDVVTGDDDVPQRADVRVHRGLHAASDGLLRRFAAADVFALPTPADAMPWAITEAMAAGLPVLTTTVGAIPELVGDAGILVAPSDPRALGAALDRLIGDPALRRSLGARAAARARERFDRRRQLSRIVEVLRGAAEP